MMWYEQSDGDNDWTSFISWLEFLSTSSDSDFESKIGDYLHIKSLLKQMVVESFMLASDNLASGQNYYVYNRVESSSSSKNKNKSKSNSLIQSSSSSSSFSSSPTLEWQIIEFDFDECFAIDSDTGLLEDGADSNVFDFFVRDPTDGEYDPLLARLLSIADHNQSYVNYYNTFLQGTFASDSPQQPADRYAGMLQFLLPWVKRDFLWQMSFGVTPDEFVLDAEATIANLPLRYQQTLPQVAGSSSVPL
jgi:hypothetical protein